MKNGENYIKPLEFDQMLLKIAQNPTCDYSKMNYF